MGTRGLFGFFYKGKYYVVYNHWDSYPSGLGYQIVKEILDAIKDGQFRTWIEQVKNLKVISGEVPPTPEDIRRLAQYTDLQVSSQSKSDWYCLLRGCQGSLTSVLNSGYILNHVDENGQPMYEEYSYIVNLDTMMLDFTGYEDPVSFRLTPQSLERLVSDTEEDNISKVWMTPSPKPSYAITHSEKEVSVSTYEKAVKEQGKKILEMKLKDLADRYGSDAFPSSWGVFILSFSDYVNRVDEDPNELALFEVGEMTNANGLQTSLEAMKFDMKTDRTDEKAGPQFNMDLLTDLEYQNLYNFSIAYDKLSDEN